MKYRLLIVPTLLVFASPAFALKVTNLDKTPHAVQLSGGSAPQTQVIQPGATEYFTGAALGSLSLVDAAPKGKAAKKPKHDSVVHADGMLSGVIGNERSENIPADPDSNYAIWPDGKLRVQSRTKHGGNAF